MDLRTEETIFQVGTSVVWMLSKSMPPNNNSFSLVQFDRQQPSAEFM